jgi:predicted enzyme related to lactoylglutathione lyase
MLKEVVTVLMFVQNISKSKEWYKKFLSMEPVEDFENFVSFRIGSTCLNLHLADNLSPVSKGGAVAYWRVDDLQATITKATSLGGVVYRGPLYVKEISRTIAQILDPLGNVFGIECQGTYKE